MGLFNSIMKGMGFENKENPKKDMFKINLINMLNK